MQLDNREWVFKLRFNTVDESKLGILNSLCIGRELKQQTNVGIPISARIYHNLHHSLV